MRESSILRSGRIHYRTIWRGDTTILFVHGWMVSGRVWNRLLPLLPDCRMVVPDLYGCGGSKSDGTPVALEDHVHDLAALCENRGLTDVHLVGHSMGGQLAAMLAARLPERFASLTLINPVPVGGLSLPPEVHALFANSGGNADALGRILDMACLALPVEAREDMLSDALDIDPATIRSGFEAWSAGRPDFNLGTATMPTVVVATDDPFLPPDFLQQAVVARLPNAKLHHLRGAGHYPQIEAPVQTAAFLQGLLR